MRNGWFLIGLTVLLVATGSAQAATVGLRDATTKNSTVSGAPGGTVELEDTILRAWHHGVPVDQRLQDELPVDGIEQRVRHLAGGLGEALPRQALHGALEAPGGRDPRGRGR